MLLFTAASYSQVAINTDGSDPDPSAMLDVKSATKGVLIPRVTLNDINTPDPVTNPHEGLLIYNIDGSVGHGLYIWNGARWIAITSDCIIPSAPGTITGDVTFCENATGVSYSISSVSGATGYNWTVPAGASVVGSGTSITVNFGITSGDVSVRAENACGNSSYTDKAVTVTAIPSAPGTITGDVTFCENATGVSYSISSVSGATGYNWTVPAGASVVGSGTSITVNFGITSGDVSVRAENACGNSSYTDKAVTVTAIPSAPGTITGDVTFCENATGVSYSISSVSGATGYNWTVPTGASVVGGQGTTDITVNFGTTSGDVSVRAENACGNSSYTDKAVTVTAIPSAPGTITGDVTFCENATGVSYSISSVSGATGYNWTVPAGASVVGSGTSITVNFGITSGDVSVRAENACGNSSYTDKAVTVTAIPSAPGTITGDVTFCENATGVSYSISSVSGATGYNWTVPTGASVVGGQGTTDITVNFGTTSGDVSVRAENACGNSSYTDKAVTVTAIPSAPGTITGDVTFCENATGVSYSISSVSGATGYNWTVPAGASVVGSGTSITVNFGITSGDVSVRAENTCGNSSYTDKAVTVTAIPSAPGTITGDATVANNATGVSYSISSVSGATGYNWTVPTGASVVGGQGTTDITVNFGTTSGDVSVRAENACGNSSYTDKAVTLSSCSSVTYGGQTYSSVEIDDQCWMAENLNIGTRIDGDTDQTNNSTIEKYCYDDDTDNCDTYGGLYQWDEMMQYVTTEGTQGICPAGWHLPTDAEWTTLTNFLGGESVAGGKMKEEGLDHWQTPNTGATNSSGFTGLPGGFRGPDGSFSNLTDAAYFWSSSEDGANAWSRFLYYGSAQVHQYTDDKPNGLSVRCLRDD